MIVSEATVVYCALAFQLILGVGGFNTASSFASHPVSLKPQLRGIRPTVAKHPLEGCKCSSRNSFHYKDCGLAVPFSSSSSSSALRAAPKIFGTIQLKNVLYDDVSTAFDAWEWTVGMGAPSALIAAAVVVTFTETRLATAPKRDDRPWVRFTKRLMRFLLLSSFALEVVSLFVGTMTGSILLGHGAQTTSTKFVGYGSPLQLLHHHHEKEYLLTQISFLQGLIHWLGAVACDLILPHPTETKSANRMNKCLASWLITLIFSIMAFYNDHLNFYSDYASMIWRLLYLAWISNVGRFRPMQLFILPSFVASIVLTWRAFASRPEED